MSGAESDAGFNLRYQAALYAYVKDPGEGGRSEAYEIGRSAFQASLSLLDFAALHHSAVEAALPRQPDPGCRSSATEFFLEALSTFDMAQRGYLEAQERARLEREHADRLGALNDAVVAVTSVEAFSERLALLAEHSRLLLAADGSGLVLEGAPDEGADGIPAMPLALAKSAAERQHRETSEVEYDGVRGFALAVPIGRGSHMVRGALVAWREQRFQSDELALLEQFTRYASLALDMSARFEREHEVAITLQHAMLPPAPPDVPGLAVAWRYRPAQARDIGGDWYDVFNVDNGDVVLVVGDIMGHDLRAAAVMGQMRLALQAYALDGYPPSEVVDRADRLLHHLDPSLLATLVYGVIDRDRRRLHLSNAGHPPPIVINRNAETTLLTGALSVPLGTDVSHVRHRQYEYELNPGSRLLFYTDGLVEDRRRPIDDGLRQLVEAIRGAGAGTEAMCEAALSVRGQDRTDDVCVLCAEILA